MERREALRYVGTVGFAAIAGCLQERAGPGTDETRSPTDTHTPTDSPTPTPAMTDHSFEVTDTGPGTKTQKASVEFGPPLTVTGTTTGPNGCYIAVLDAVEYSGSKLVVTVRAKEKAGSKACTQAITNVDYRATFEFAGDGPETVVVKHDSMGEVRTVATAERSG